MKITFQNLGMLTFLLLFFSATVLFTACDKDDGPDMVQDDDDDDDDDDDELVFTVGNEDVSGVWKAGSVVTVNASITIPENESLTIEEGVRVIMAGDGSIDAPEIRVRGSLYCYGTENDRILISARDEDRTPENYFRGLWGGILATETVKDMVFEYTDIEYTGAPAQPGSPIVAEGEIDEGEPRYAIYMQDDGLTSNLVLWHSRIAYTKDDAIRLNGARTLIAYSVFELNGETGGEAVNTKSGTVGDFAYNLIYGSATNGLKAANSKGREPQCDNYYYNNTIVNSGWRRAQAGRGGSLNYEAGARGQCYNNLVVNCRFGLRLRQPDSEPDLDNLKYDFNYYFGNHQEIVNEFYPSVGMLGDELPLPENDIAGDVGENDPLFANYDVTLFDHFGASDGSNAQPMSGNFSLKSDSPAASGGTVDFSPRFDSYVVNGRTYITPAPSPFFGAFGVGN